MASTIAGGAIGASGIASPETYNVTASDIATGAPVLDAPAAAEVDNVVALDISTGAPVLDAPAVTQLHNLIAVDIATGAPTLDVPALQQLHNLIALDIVTGAPVLDAPPAFEVDQVIALDISTGAPVLDAPEVFFGTVQERFIAGLLGRYTCDALIVLLEISHATLETPIRVNNSGAALVSQAEVFQHFPFMIELPSDDEKEPVAKLRIANVDRRIGDVIDAITTPATVGISLVSSVDPSTILRAWSFYELRNVTRTALEVTGDLILRQYAIEPFPNIRVRQSNFQNLYRV